MLKNKLRGFLKNMFNIYIDVEMYLEECFEDNGAGENLPAKHLKLSNPIFNRFSIIFWI